MMKLHPEFIVDEQARKKAVVLPIEEWEQLLEALEMAEDIRAYDEVRDEETLDWASVKETLETAQ